MARIEIGYVRTDIAFVERLVADLGRHGLSVTLREWSAGDADAQDEDTVDSEADFACLVLSPASTQHERAAAEIARALKRESGPQGATILPLLIEAIVLPETLASRRCAVFASGYEAGLAELLPTFGRIVILTLIDRPDVDVKVLSARRGIAKRFGSFTLDDGITPASAIDSHRIRLVSGVSLRGAAVMALIESVGDPAHTPEFTELVGATVLDAFTRNELQPTNESFSQLYSKVDESAREMSMVRQLRRSRRLSCKLAVALRGTDGIYWASAGAMGLLTRFRQDDDTEGFGFCESRYKFEGSVEEDDNEALSYRAPLGYLTSIELEVQRVPFRMAGDYFALSSFPLPMDAEESRALVNRLVRYKDPAHVVRALAASHEPLFDDCAASVMYRVR